MGNTRCADMPRRNVQPSGEVAVPPGMLDSCTEFTIHRMNPGLICGSPKSGEAFIAFRTMFTLKTTSDRILTTSQPREGRLWGRTESRGCQFLAHRGAVFKGEQPYIG
jgi:hypothetical protein